MWTWVLTNWRWVAGGVALAGLLGSTAATLHCAGKAKEAREEAQRLHDAAMQATGRAESREVMADALGALVAPLLDAGTAAAERAEQAVRHEVELLDAGAGDSIPSILDDLREVWDVR